MTNPILFSLGKPSKKPDIKGKIGNEIIKEKEYTKYLGLLIDNKLSWEHHIKYLNIKIIKGLGVISRIRQFVSKNTIRMLYFAFAQQHIDYGLLLWGNANKSLTKIITKNLKIIRKILFKKYNHPTKALFKELNILPFENQKSFLMLQFMWKITFDQMEENIKSLFKQRERTFGENDVKFHIPNVNLDRTKNSIIF